MELKKDGTDQFWWKTILISAVYKDAETGL